MKLITLKPSFFRSSSKKKKSRSPSIGSSTSSSSESITTPKSILDGGTITRHELELVLRRLNPDPPSEEEVLAMLAEAGGSRSGRITISDLGPMAGTELKETFKVFDADGDGKISAEELMGVLVMVGDEECSVEMCRRMIGEVDSDGDGFVCFQDFVCMMEGKR